MRQIINQLRKMAGWLREKAQEPEAGCGKCAVCHHVCQLLEKRRSREN